MRFSFQVFKKKAPEYDITIFQTPDIGEKKGYEPVYQTELDGRSHREVLDTVFSKFNVLDTVPSDYKARFIRTGDIVLISENKKKETYYKLSSMGWREITIPNLPMSAISC
ncbi:MULTISPECIES: YodL domain-containing protein [Bacillus]|uniref:YodL-like domain-containing protein n=2 Tax=Bacillus TaxID=1386 RepID=A0A0M4FQ86_9BACI|nr:MULTISPECIES: YodL domain-containing protein [Bacillus]ALC81323.1 hypothetical protein AM592_06730 [Bacillus gobiensis]MBP1080334.1 hypothetical protein [Bacillus capparidis]MED1094196.1 YodL domain-containing protein [Bacillus capparidis]